MICILMRGATMWEWQIGRIWIAIRYPRLWLYGRQCASGRTYLYNWPGFVRIVGADSQ